MIYVYMADNFKLDIIYICIKCFIIIMHKKCNAFKIINIIIIIKCNK